MNQPFHHVCRIEHHVSSSSNTEIVARTPLSNTGLNSQEQFQVGIDWLDISFRNVPDSKALADIIAEIESISGDCIDFSSSRATFNGREWSGSGRGAIGTLLWYDSGARPLGEKPVAPQLKIAIPGSVMKHIDQIKLSKWLISRIAKNELDCTRMDIALDDRDKFIELGKITEAMRAGNFFNATKRGYQESGGRGDDMGVTVYFGSPKSDKILRTYDKTIESKGEILGNRWEAQLRRKTAREALFQWLEKSDDSFASAKQWCKDVVVGLIDFRDRTGDDPNRARCPLLDWYQSFINRLQAVPLAIRKPQPLKTVQKSIDWVVEAVAPTLSLIGIAIKEDFPKFMEELLLIGEDRLSKKREFIAIKTDKKQLCY